MGTGEITTRRAQPSDAAGLHKLNELFNGAGSNTIPNIVEMLRTNDLEIVCVATDGEHLVGFCCSHICKSFCYPVNHAEMTELFVLDEYRMQGIGRRLLSYMEQLLVERGARHLHILTSKNNTTAQALYRSCGYNVTSEILLDKDVNTTGFDPHPASLPVSSANMSSHSGTGSAGTYDS